MPLDTTSPVDSGNQQLAFTVNGVPYKTRDPILHGRDVLQMAGFTPSSEHVLIELTRPGSKSIGLDEDVDLREPGREVFRAFASDRTFNFTVDERGYEWGAPTITEIELREITDTPVTKGFVVERQDSPDRPLEEGDSLNLAERGTEHIRSRQRMVRIIVNAREVEVAATDVSYAQLVAFAFNPVPTGPEVLFTITYRKGPPPEPKGTVAEGQTVPIKNGEIFVVTQTNRS